MTTYYTQRAVLSCIGLIYFFAFSSVYFQIPGLYGENGLLPAKRHLISICHNKNQQCRQWAKQSECENNPAYMNINCKASCKICEPGSTLPIGELFNSKPTVLWFSRYFGLDTGSFMELVTILGSILSLLVSVSPWRFGLQHFVSYSTLWFLYFSLYQVGETFLYFQWDILLLETGFLAIIMSTWINPSKYDPKDSGNVSLWLMKWLLFRLMFASGVVKLTSECPTWWGLTALNYHYESQCIPTPLAWYAHQLPDWFQSLSVAATYAIEIAIPFLFFAPMRSLRLFGFYSQVFFQVAIILTGNYTFFNLLTIVLCLSLTDDEMIFGYKMKFLSGKGNGEQLVTKKKERKSVLKSMVVKILFSFLFIFSVIFMKRLFVFKKISPGKFRLTTNFAIADLHSFLSTFVPLSIALGLVSLIIEIGKMFVSSMKRKCFFQKVTSFMSVTVTALIAFWIFGISLIPFTELDRGTHARLWPVLRHWHGDTSHLHIANSYGLFRRMTGVGGRPEIVIEGSNNSNGPWKEYHFMYKPEDMSSVPPVVAPHQPRLDWQMWFAALGRYEHNPWFVHLIYKLLHGEQSVLDLMGDNPFPDKPPKYIKSTLYHYHYTKVSSNANGIFDGLARASGVRNWWRREKQSPYTPPLTKDDEKVKKGLQKMGLALDLPPEKVSLGPWYVILNIIRHFSRLVDPTVSLLLVPTMLSLATVLIRNK